MDEISMNKEISGSIFQGRAMETIAYSFKKVLRKFSSTVPSSNRSKKELVEGVRGRKQASLRS